MSFEKTQLEEKIKDIESKINIEEFQLDVLENELGNFRVLLDDALDAADTDTKKRRFMKIDGCLVDISEYKAIIDRMSSSDKQLEELKLNLSIKLSSIETAKRKLDSSRNLLQSLLLQVNNMKCVIIPFRRISNDAR
jgi:chromosome segregation ATPase